MASGRRCFVILPYAGGTAQSFRMLGKILAAEGEVVAIDYPPADERDMEAGRTISRWAEHVQAALQPICAEFVLFGHSMGALVAYELARRLAGRADLAHLFLSGCAFPGGPAFRELTGSGDAAALARRLAERGGMRADATGPAHEARLVQHLRALVSYRFDPEILACPVTCLAGHDDAIAPHESMPAWASVTSRSFELVDLPGDHFFFSGNNRRVGEIIGQALARA